jgi:glucitol operon activator protein
MILSFFQVRRYQQAIKKWRGKGILGIGQQKGLLKPGEILILVYSRAEDKVVSVQSMKGYTIFAAFREVKDYGGLSLDELRAAGLEADAKEFRGYRKKHPYNPTELTKKKGALIQAVEAVDRYIKREKEKESDDD